MAINNQNIDTTGDGEDIFYLTGGEIFFNYGALATSGDIASPIRVQANSAPVVNLAALTTSGDGSPGVRVGDIFDENGNLLGASYDNGAVLNYGTITTAGDLVADDRGTAFAAGIYAVGNNNSVLNFGTISATGSETPAIYTRGTDAHIENNGRIESGFFGIVADDDDFPFFFFSHHIAPVGATANGSAIMNKGEIQLIGKPTGVGWGAAMIACGAESTSKNYGTVLLDGEFSNIVDGVDAALPGSIAENYGKIYATADRAYGLNVFFGNNLLRNYGTIRIKGSDSVGIHLDGGNSRGENYGSVRVLDRTSRGVELGRLPQHTGNIGGAKFFNYGTIQTVGTAILGSEFDDLVTNRGLLVGDVSLDPKLRLGLTGDDTYVAGAKGRLDGVLTLGDGDDLIVFEKNGGSLTVTDFMPGAGTDDMIDLRPLGYANFSEVMSHASQVDNNVVLDFKKNGRIVLQNVGLDQLHADDFWLTDDFWINAEIRANVSFARPARRARR